MRKKLLLNFAVVTAFQILLIIIVIMNFRFYEKKMNHIQNELFRIVEYAERLDSNIDKVQIQLYRIKTGEENYLDQMITHIENISYSIFHLEKFGDIRPKIKDIIRLKKLIERFDFNISRIAVTKDAEVIDKLSRDTYFISVDMRIIIDEITSNVQNQSDLETREAYESFYTVLVMLLVFCVVIIIMSYVLGKRISSFIVKPMNEMISGIDNISRGNFNYKIKLKTRDEFEKLAEAFNGMSENLGLVEAKKIEALQQLATTIEHKINNPLAGILGTIYVLKNNGSLSREVIEILNELEKEIIRIKEVTTKLRGLKEFTTTDYLDGRKMFDF